MSDPYWRGKITTAEFSDGKPWISDDCAECCCECHDDRPKPEGTYVTLRLDGNPIVSLAAKRFVLVPENELPDLLAQAWDEGHNAGCEAFAALEVMWARIQETRAAA